MSGFDAGWLALRDPFDRAARTPADDALAAGPRPLGTLHVLDLGCGTGASVRALARRLGGRQRWTLVDHDAGLLATLPQAVGAWARAQGLRLQAQGTGLVLQGAGLHAELACRRADLATGLATLPFPQGGLVTASALLDLVSDDWLAGLVAHTRAAGAAVCWALSVDGRGGFAPADPDDALVQSLFAAHQQRDKGFGPALGAAAPARAAALLRAAGYRTTLLPSDWCIDAARGGDDQAMARALVDGMAAAAVEQAPAQAGAVQAWRARRLGMLARTRLCVGHGDLLGWL